METNNDQREQDILKLCEAVLNMSPNTYYNPNGADTSTCPMCYERVYNVYNADGEMQDIKHLPTCGYLIAKDLSTNLITKP